MAAPSSSFGSERIEYSHMLGLAKRIRDGLQTSGGSGGLSAAPPSNSFARRKTTYTAAGLPPANTMLEKAGQVAMRAGFDISEKPEMSARQSVPGVSRKSAMGMSMGPSWSAPSDFRNLHGSLREMGIGMEVHPARSLNFKNDLDYMVVFNHAKTIRERKNKIQQGGGDASHDPYLLPVQPPKAQTGSIPTRSSIRGSLRQFGLSSAPKMLDLARQIAEELGWKTKDEESLTLEQRTKLLFVFFQRIQARQAKVEARLAALDRAKF